MYQDKQPYVILNNTIDFGVRNPVEQVKLKDSRHYNVVKV